MVSGLLLSTMSCFSQASLSLQLTQVSPPLSKAHSHVDNTESQCGVFTPSIWQPEWLVISGVISIPFSFNHIFTIIRHSTSSLFDVAIQGSQVSQPIPQYAKYVLTGIPPIFSHRCVCVTSVSIL